MAFIEMTGITKTYAGIRALDGVDFDARDGEIHGLVGANGSGKTTLVHIIAGLVSPDAGRISIGGSPAAIGGVKGAQELGIGIAYQDSQLINGITIAQSLMLGREPRGRFGMIRERDINDAAKDFLGKIGLDDIPVEKSASLMPDGMRKFVEAARAILIGTKLAIFDEPTAGLDGEETGRMEVLIRRLKDGGLPVILVSHDIGFIIGMCDRVTVLDRGSKTGVFVTGETGRDDLSRMIGEPAAFPSRGEPAGEVVLSLPGGGAELRAGETVGIYVPGGDIKTGLIRSIFGNDPRNSGDYSIFGFKMRVGPPGG
ncbi:MAG: ATP-binding cassette domain-containing protein, partial [Synergistaceae bacterium]|nr:ATP-binding cassette domain-containing protein [Synergistaceae bacterium]